MSISKPNGRTDWILLLFSGVVVTCLTAGGRQVVRHNREIGEVRQQVLGEIADRAAVGLRADQAAERRWVEVRDQLRSIENRIRQVEMGIIRLEERGLTDRVVDSNTKPTSRKNAISGYP